MELVEFKELRKVYGQTLAVDGISFNVGQGEVFGLLGPNGAGKSTTISVLATILKPTSGDVLVKGRSVSADPEFARKIIGLVPQEVALYPSLTARENLEFFGRMYGLRRNELHKRINEALEVSGLMDRADDRVETFSGGM
ncbi:MAG: ABC transporter ATP-binding protein, partial [Acidobacteriota bacterium]